MTRFDSTQIKDIQWSSRVTYGRTDTPTEQSVAQSFHTTVAKNDPPKDKYVSNKKCYCTIDVRQHLSRVLKTVHQRQWISTLAWNSGAWRVMWTCGWSDLHDSRRIANYCQRQSKTALAMFLTESLKPIRLDNTSLAIHVKRDQFSCKKQRLFSSRFIFKYVPVI